MKICFTLILPLVAYYVVQAQQSKPVPENPGTYFNEFQKTTNNDSCLFFARKLASNPRYAILLTDLIHNSFAQQFMKHDIKTTDMVKAAADRKELTRNKDLLKAMAFDTSRALARSVRPIYYWTEIMDSKSDIKKQDELARKFMQEEQTSKDIYENRVGRYALLISGILANNNTSNALSANIFNATKNRLRIGQPNVNVDTASREILDKRAWYRYMFAYCNFVEGNQLLKEGNIAEAGKSLRLAYDHSPDLTDKDHYAAYFYDMVFLTGGEEKSSFQNDYLNYLTTYKKDKDETLAALLKIALADPAFKDKLKAYYTSNFPKREEFNSFWLANINAYAAMAPQFTLTETNGHKFSSLENKGKWILIDFWGTWCGPCRKEHPDLNKFASAKPDNLMILTIACKDTKPEVEKYMLQNKYSFPVTMSDLSIEKAYHVQEYPTKILITPQGKYLAIPYVADWQTFIKNYIGN